MGPSFSGVQKYRKSASPTNHFIIIGFLFLIGWYSCMKRTTFNSLYTFRYEVNKEMYAQFFNINCKCIIL